MINLYITIEHKSNITQDNQQGLLCASPSRTVESLIY